MKPTARTRQSWSLVVLTLAGFAMLFWGCGHTRQIVYPGRKVAPPRIVESKTPGSKQKAVESLEENDRFPMSPKRHPEAPSSIDVPFFDRNDR